MMFNKIKLSDLANKLDAILYGNGDVFIDGVSALHKAKSSHVTFFYNKYYNKQHLINCKAAAIILTKENLTFCKTTALVVQNPYLSFVKVVQLMNNILNPSDKTGKFVTISPTATIGKNVKIGENSVIEDGVILKDNVILGSGCFIGKNSCINSNTKIWANVVIYHDSIIGEDCLIQAGTVIGSDGFGYVNDGKQWIKIPHLGKVIIGNLVKIGSCTTIDRGTLENTEIGNGVIIDNQCQIAHNVIIGHNTAIAGGVIIAGSAIIGKNCMIGGASVINGHIKICDEVIITGMSMVMKTITEKGIYSSGIPVKKNREWRKMTVLLMHIHMLNKKIHNIEKKLQQYKIDR